MHEPAFPGPIPAPVGAAAEIADGNQQEPKEHAEKKWRYFLLVSTFQRDVVFLYLK